MLLALQDNDDEEAATLITSAALVYLWRAIP
jgi:hypothetical protein